MIYEYKDELGNIIERDFPMQGEIPKVVENEGIKYFRVWSVPLFNIATKADNFIHKDMDDFSRCSISTDSVAVNSPGCGKVQAQLRVDGHGNEEMVYKSNPTRVIPGKPSNAVIDKLGKKMENYLNG